MIIYIYIHDYLYTCIYYLFIYSHAYIYIYIYLFIYILCNLWDIEATMKTWFIYPVLSGWECSIHCHRDLDQPIMFCRYKVRHRSYVYPSSLLRNRHDALYGLIYIYIEPPWTFLPWFVFSVTKWNVRQLCYRSRPSPCNTNGYIWYHMLASGSNCLSSWNHVVPMGFHKSGWITVFRHPKDQILVYVISPWYFHCIPVPKKWNISHLLRCGVGVTKQLRI